VRISQGLSRVSLLRKVASRAGYWQPFCAL
jgi:hypothetical protein